MHDPMCLISGARRKPRRAQATAQKRRREQHAPLLAAIGLALCGLGGAAAAASAERIKLELRPKVCTLAAADQHCETPVQARWRSRHDESLCLVIVGRPEIKRCWERHSAGIYTLELVFDADLIVELRDPQLERVLAQKTLKVIKEALQLRRKRRQPWSILF